MHNNQEPRANGPEGDGGRKLLSFSLGGEVYGVNILRVKEIRGWSPVTRIPHSANSVLGVLNLRGTVVPIIDLRLRFGMQSAEFTPVTVIIVLSLNSESGQREVGIVVDSVKDVVDIEAGSIKPAPSMSDSESSVFIEGIATHDGEMLILLDAESLAFNERSSTRLAAEAA
jgi:purine-binding chemotaxis protein CheW